MSITSQRYIPVVASMGARGAGETSTLADLITFDSNGSPVLNLDQDLDVFIRYLAREEIPIRSLAAEIRSQHGELDVVLPSLGALEASTEEVILQIASELKLWVTRKVSENLSIVGTPRHVNPTLVASSGEVQGLISATRVGTVGPTVLVMSGARFDEPSSAGADGGLPTPWRRRATAMRTAIDSVSSSSRPVHVLQRRVLEDGAGTAGGGVGNGIARFVKSLGLGRRVSFPIGYWEADPEDGDFIRARDECGRWLLLEISVDNQLRVIVLGPDDQRVGTLREVIESTGETGSWRVPNDYPTEPEPTDRFQVSLSVTIPHTMVYPATSAALEELGLSRDEGPSETGGLPATRDWVIQEGEDALSVRLTSPEMLDTPSSWQAVADVVRLLRLFGAEASWLSSDNTHIPIQLVDTPRVDDSGIATLDLWRDHEKLAYWLPRAGMSITDYVGGIQAQYSVIDALLPPLDAKADPLSEQVLRVASQLGMWVPDLLTTS